MSDCAHVGVHTVRHAVEIKNVIKEIYLSKVLTCMKFFLYKQKMGFFLSRRQISLATLLYEQFIHLT